MAIDPRSVTASRRHLSPLSLSMGRPGRGRTAASLAPFLYPGQGERWHAKRDGVGVLRFNPPYAIALPDLGDLPSRALEGEVCAAQPNRFLSTPR